MLKDYKYFFNQQFLKTNTIAVNSPGKIKIISTLRKRMSTSLLHLRHYYKIEKHESQNT
jgi:hypothetical protein